MTEAEKHAPTLADLRARRDDILRLAAQHKAYNVRVFGSVARGDSKPASDVDLLVTFEKGASLYDLSGLWQDLEELLGHSVDVVSEHRHMKERFRTNILRDAVSL
jgi:hypothetical protein